MSTDPFLAAEALGSEPQSESGQSCTNEAAPSHDPCGRADSEALRPEGLSSSSS